MAVALSKVILQMLVNRTKRNAGCATTLSLHSFPGGDAENVIKVGHCVTTAPWRAAFMGLLDGKAKGRLTIRIRDDLITRKVQLRWSSW